LWISNPLLQAWYRGEQITTDREPWLDLRSISTDEVRHYYHLALRNSNTATAKAMRYRNQFLQSALNNIPLDKELDIDKNNLPTSFSLFSGTGFTFFPQQVATKFDGQANELQTSYSQYKRCFT
jgi:hypothetical protein